MKTNVMRLLDAKKIPYVGHEYEQDPSMTGGGDRIHPGGGGKLRV